MKKAILLFSLLLISTPVIFSQTIKLENGISISSMNSEKFTLLNKNIHSYSMTLGCDYWEHPYFYLSSEIGYIRTGGKDQILLLYSEHSNPIPTTIVKRLDYLHGVYDKIPNQLTFL
jgi:hypothetical protein